MSALIGNPLLLTSAPAAGGDAYQIEKSLKFNSADSAYLTREPSAESNRRIWTWAGWVKKCGTADQAVFYADNGGTTFVSRIQLSSEGDLALFEKTDDVIKINCKTNALLRDHSAWYHIVVALDTTQATASDRVKMYINGELQSLGTATYPDQYLETRINSLEGQTLGRQDSGSGKYLNSYLADVQFIDGLALSPAAFGSFDSTGVWNPKAFALPAPNDGTTWSSSLTTEGDDFESGYPATKLFDGYLTTVTASDEGSHWIKFTPSGGISYSQSVRVYQKNPDGSDTNNTTFTLTDTDGTVRETKVADNAGLWTTLHEGKGTFTELKAEADDSSNDPSTNWNYWAAIEVDGVLLIDGQTDPTTRNNPNDGTTWSDTFTGTFHSNGQGNAVNTFDGSLDTQSYGADASTLTFLPPTTITANTKIEIYVYTKGSITGQNDLKLNNSSIFSAVNTALGNDTWGWYDLGKTLNSTHGLVIGRHDNDNKVNIKAIKVDGHILVDSSVDNSFHLKFNDTSSNAALGFSSLPVDVNDPDKGGPILKTKDDSSGRTLDSDTNTDSNASSLVLAIPGNSATDVHHTVKGSGSAKTITYTGTCSAKTDVSRYYGTSTYVGGDGYIKVAQTNDCLFSGQLTIEGWFYLDEGTNNCVLVWSDGTGTGRYLVWTDSSKLTLVVYAGSNGNTPEQRIQGSTVLTTKRWYHMAVCRNSSDLVTLYLNGVSQGTWDSSSFSNSLGGQSNDTAPEIGSQDGGNGVKGYLQDWRFYTTCKYTSNFDPQAPKDFTVTNLTAETGTSWGGAKTVTATSGATTTTSNTKFYGTSKDLDGSNDYINTQTSDDWNFPGEFTVELWFRPEATTGIRPLIAARDSDSGWCFGYWPGTSGKLTFYTGGSPATDVEVQWTPSSLFTNTWTHVAVTRNSSNTLTLWVNGDDKATSTVTGTLTVESDDPIQIGNVWPSGMTQYDGQFGDIRIYKGVCKYVADFTVPDGSTSVASATGGLPIRNTSGTNGETALTGFRADVIPGTSTDVSQNLVLAIPGNTYEDVSGQIRKASPSELDSLVDSPTNYGEQSDPPIGGEVRGNYATLNPLAGNLSLIQGNLGVSNPSSNHKCSNATMAFPKTGKYYIEIESTSANATNTSSGIGITNRARGWTTYPGTTAETYWIYSQSDAWLHYPGSDDGNIPGVGDFGDPGKTWQFAIDMDNQKIFIGDGSKWYRKGSGGNTKEDDGNPVTGANPTLSGFSGDDEWFFFVESYDAAFNLNFGQRPFKYTAPAGHKCLCTQNLPDTFSGAALNNPSKYFDVKTWTGTGASRDIKGIGFGPDLIWVKERGATNDHQLYDQLRGTGKRLRPNEAAAEATQTGGVNAFLSGGWTQGDAGTMNNSGDTYVGWLWNAGTAAATPKSGASGQTITATASWVNTDAGFEMLAYQGADLGGSNLKLGHNLGDEPAFMIFKNRDTANSWCCYHKSIGNGDHIRLDDPAAKNTATILNDDGPANELITLSDDSNVWDDTASGNNFIAYIWREVSGYSSFGSYEGNADDDGPFIYTGHTPKFIVMKGIDSEKNWILIDSERDGDNVTVNKLYADADSSESTSANGQIDILSNGFKLRKSSAMNNASETFIYASWAEHPFKTTRAR